MKKYFAMLLAVAMLLTACGGDSNTSENTGDTSATYKVGIVLLILLMIGMCTQERFFCQFLCPMGTIFAIMPIAPSALFNRDKGTCPAKCGACKKRCPAHLDIDGDTPLSGECICCHACQGICPKRNIRIGIPKAKDESLF